MYHRSVGIVQKIEFEISPILGCIVQPSKRREKWFWTIRRFVCLSCCRFSRELSRAEGLTDRVETLGALLARALRRINIWGDSYPFIR